MAEPGLRGKLKAIVPFRIRRVMRALLHYCQRVSRWVVVLWQLRGVTPSDQWVLLRSAVYSLIVSAHDLMKWQDPVLLKDCRVDVRGVGRFAVRARCDDLWHVLPWREQGIADLLRRTLKPGDVFIDAGANIGVYTVLAAGLVGPTGSVISIEMMPDTSDRLLEHVRLNHLVNVRVVRKALSEFGGTDMFATVQPEKFGQATIAVNSAQYGIGEKVAVKTETLDAITEGILVVRMMKMDVEGAELSALMGASLLLDRLSSLVYESWGSKREGGDAVDDLLLRSGFNLRQLDGNNWVAFRP